MYEKCIAWISSTDCLSMTSMYQLLHPDWRKFPHRLQYGWTQDHQDLLHNLHKQILCGEVSSSYYSSDSEYEMAGKKHLLHTQRPFLGKPVVQRVVTRRDAADVDGDVDGDSGDDYLQYDADDEYDVHPPDVAYTEREIESMSLSTRRSSRSSSTESFTSSSTRGQRDRDPDNDFQVYSYDALTNRMRVTTYTIPGKVHPSRDHDREFANWVILST